MKLSSKVFMERVEYQVKLLMESNECEESKLNRINFAKKYLTLLASDIKKHL